jgi:uncharacterized protein with ParB-like and HNH nuclease domain
MVLASLDGQQRLTTFQLFLAAIRHVAIEMSFADIADSVQNYLFNRPMTGDKDAEAKFKLAPTPEDRKIFFELIEVVGNRILARGGEPLADLAMEIWPGLQN